MSGTCPVVSTPGITQWPYEFKQTLHIHAAL